MQPSTACSSIGLNPSRSGSTRHGIYCLKFWKSFERQEQEVSWSTPTGPFSHGFKKCSGCPPSTSACHLLVTVSDRTTLASSSPSSIERCVCGQWSSTVCNVDYNMYSSFLTASSGSVLFSRSTLLKRKDLCFSCLRLGLIRHRRSKKPHTFSQSTRHDFLWRYFEKLIF